jgi:hypothetical protein
MSEPLAPRMVRWSGLGMRLQEMVQDMQQGYHMLLVASGELSLPNIVDNHVQHFVTAVFLGQEVGSECCCSDFGRCSCSAMASTSSSVKPHRPTQSSSVIIFAPKTARLSHSITLSARASTSGGIVRPRTTPYHIVERGCASHHGERDRSCLSRVNRVV